MFGLLEGKAWKWWKIRDKRWFKTELWPRLEHLVLKVIIIVYIRDLCTEVPHVLRLFLHRSGQNEMHSHVLRLMHIHRYAHRGQLWASNPTCCLVRASGCTPDHKPVNTWLHSAWKGEWSNWPHSSLDKGYTPTSSHIPAVCIGSGLE